MSNEVAPINSYVDMSTFDAYCRVSKCLAASALVPQNFQGKPENIFVALQLANRLNCDPMMVMQNVYIVYGTPTFSASFAIALANNSKAFKSVITYEVTGKGTEALAVTAKATLANGQEVSETVTLAEAKSMGWYGFGDKVKPLWKAKPEYMLKKRSATFLIRTYAPEILLGFHADEEIEDAKTQELISATKNFTNKTLLQDEYAKLNAATNDETTEVKAKRGRPPKDKSTEISTAESVTEAQLPVEPTVSPEVRASKYTEEEMRKLIHDVGF